MWRSRSHIYKEKVKKTNQHVSVSRAYTSMLTIASLFLIILCTIIATVGVTHSLYHSATTTEKLAVVAVEKKRIEQNIHGSLVRTALYSISVPSQGIVTRAGSTQGSELNLGSVIGVVNEIPIFLFAGEVPSYQPLGRGAQGEDVAQLQRGLRGLGYSIYDPDGIFSDSTALALFHYYRKLGFVPHTAEGTTLSLDTEAWKSTGIPQNNIVFFPQLPAVATTNCGKQGQEVSSELCKIESTAESYSLSIPSGELATLNNSSLTGKKVRILSSPQQTATIENEITVPASSSSTSGQDESFSSQEDALSLTHQSDSTLTHSDGDPSQKSTTSHRIFSLSIPQETKLPDNIYDIPVTVILKTTSNPVLTLPAIALQHDKNTFIKTDKGTRINVRVGLCNAGTCEVSGPHLSESTRVVIPAQLSTPGGE